LFFWLKRPVPNTSRITACTALSPPTVTPVPTGDLAALPPRSHHPNDRLASAGRHLPPAHKELPDMNASAQLAALNMPAAARRIAQPLPSPALLRQRLPLEPTLAAHVHAQRQAIRAILDGRDQRLLVVVGPCSIHDPVAALEYAQRLADLAPEVDDQLLLVMRAYMEKPRTTVGWKGLVYDPHLDGSHAMAEGLSLSRRLMLDMLALGLPLATELLQPLAAGYFDDLLAWAAIGARTSESQIHRELVSGLDLPVGFKNGTDGCLGIACDAMRSAAHSHSHFGIDELGHPARVQTAGNRDT